MEEERGKTYVYTRTASKEENGEKGPEGGDKKKARDAV